MIIVDKDLSFLIHVYPHIIHMHFVLSFTLYNLKFISSFNNRNSLEDINSNTN